MSGQKRRRTQSDAGADDGRFGLLKGLFSSVEKDMQTYNERVIQPAKREAAEMQRRATHPPFVRFLAQNRADWTDAHERQAVDQWQAAKEDCNMPDTSRTQYLTLWKTAMHHANCSPMDIVGVRTNQVYEGRNRGQTQDNFLNAWPDTFCEKLDRLIVHPAWTSWDPAKGRAEPLAMAIQYAVILRCNDDAQPWKPVTTDAFLADVKRFSCLGHTIREAHSQARQAMMDRGVGYNHYHISNVLQALEVHLPERKPNVSRPTAEARNSGGFYNVRTTDLTNLTKALDSMRDAYAGAWPSTETL